MINIKSNALHTTVLRPVFQDHPREPVPEENFWTLWCKGRLTEADTPTVATPSGLTSAYLHHSVKSNAVTHDVYILYQLKRTGGSLQYGDHHGNCSTATAVS